mmetsp:Transcript_50282/g.155393  ORF Transcript_50282/g.155393 Transcript_50282/m.155393 type:complete len:214 (+) Transcript_50282:408-1049(+)
MSIGWGFSLHSGSCVCCGSNSLNVLRVLPSSPSTLGSILTSKVSPGWTFWNRLAETLRAISASKGNMQSKEPARSVVLQYLGSVTEMLSPVLFSRYQTCRRSRRVLVLPTSRRMSCDADVATSGRSLLLKNCPRLSLLLCCLACCLPFCRSVCCSSSPSVSAAASCAALPLCLPQPQSRRRKEWPATSRTRPRRLLACCCSAPCWSIDMGTGS